MPPLKPLFRGERTNDSIGLLLARRIDEAAAFFCGLEVASISTLERAAARDVREMAEKWGATGASSGSKACP